MKSIAFITTQAFSIHNFRGYFISDLVQKGYTVFALASDYDDKSRLKVKELGAIPVDYEFSRNSLNPFQDLYFTALLIKILIKLKPDTVIAYFIKPVIYGIIASWLAGVKGRIALIEGLGSIYSNSINKSIISGIIIKKLVKRLHKISLSKASIVIFLNHNDRDEMIQNKLVDEKKSIVLGGIGVNLDEWTPQPAVVDPITFILVARLIREKGIIEYCEAAKKIKLFNPEVQFLLLGALDSNPYSFTEHEVETLCNQSGVKWLGHVDVRPWLSSSSVFVLPSYYREGVPRSSQEALALAKPIITTDLPGCRETVIDGYNGFTVPPQNVDSLVQKMQIFISDKSLIEKMGHASRVIAEDKFNAAFFNEKMINTVESINESK